jgi:ketosteroid isomerase-like protein
MLPWVVPETLAVAGRVDGRPLRALVWGMKYLLLALALGACASPSGPADELETSPVASPAPVIAAEREFAADAAQRGWVAAFRTYAAPEAIMLSPDPVNAQAQLAEIEGDGSTALDWRPAYAGISRSGDFGFTTGPFQMRGRAGIVGHYFTVWRRQADGSWKWIFDAGTDVRDPGPAVEPDAAIPSLAIAESGVSDGEAAMAAIAALEEANARPVSLAGLLADGARVNRPYEAAAVGGQAAFRLMAAEGGSTFTSLRREASSGGDMVFSMGEVRDTNEGVARLRYYARIWQWQPEGWRIVFDEIVPRRGG